MNSTKNIEKFVNQLLDVIVDHPDPVNHYDEIEQNRSDIINDLGLTIETVRTNEIVSALNKSEYQHLYQNVILNDLADVIFLNKFNTQNLLDKIGFQQMLLGVTKHGIDGVYNHESHPEFNDHVHGITLNNVVKYFVKKEDNQMAELKANVATFIEYYHNTAEGKAFIGSFEKIKDQKLKDEFFDEFFEKMNKSSLIPRIGDKDINGKRSFKSGEGGDLDGFFILVDDDFNMSFNISTTISASMSIEKDSVLRHAITSKFIADAISELIDDEIEQHKLNLDYLGEKYLIKEDRASVWKKHSSDEFSKNNFIHKALMNKIRKQELDLDISTNYNDIEIKSGESIKTTVKEINGKIKPAFIINTILNTSGVITKEKVKKFFDMNKNFNSHFVCNTPDAKPKSEFMTSDLKKKMDAIDMKITDFRAFLQISALKDGFLTDHGHTPAFVGFDKGAIDCFFNDILIRRIFNKPSQEKINEPNYLKEMESLIFNEFILAPDDVVQKNKSYLNKFDDNHFHQYLTFILNDINSPERIKSKLKDLNINTSYDEVLKKVSDNYPKIFSGTELLLKNSAQSKELEEKDKIIDQAQQEKEDLKATARRYFLENNIPVPKEFQDAIDYTSGQKAIADIEKSANINKDKPNKNLSTLNKKLS